ncbi:hypothetical protein, partial [Salmonella sp. s58408]|uniref:hypothetical protein n=1 Tax=Salmonella sp. s58408 TaxID=3159701 RepID=UPI0039806EB4
LLFKHRIARREGHHATQAKHIRRGGWSSSTIAQQKEAYKKTVFPAQQHGWSGSGLQILF